MSEKKFTPQDFEERLQQREKVLENFVESLKPWLFEFGNWIFGGLIAFNIIVVAALLTVGPNHPEIQIAITAFACALPLNVSGLFLLKIFKDMSDVSLDDVMRQAFLDANIPNVEAYFPASEEKEAQHKRRTDAGLRYALTLAALSAVLTTAGIFAALWYMAWWIGTIFLVVVIGSIILVMRVLSRWMPAQSDAERELMRQRYQQLAALKKSGVGAKTMIETERLILRNFKPDDLAVYYQQIYSDADVTRYLPGGKPRPIDRTQYVMEYAMDHAKKHGFTFWAVETKADHQLIGHCGLVYLQEEPEVEVAYAFGKAHWGQGFATEGAAASLRYGFETAELDHILALAEPENLASQRVMQKIGMKHEGITEQFYNHKLALYRLNRDEWMPDTGFYRYE